METNIENLSFKILSNEIYGNNLMEELNSTSFENSFESMSVIYLKQFMESIYLALNSKKEDIALRRMEFARNVYEKQILQQPQYYNQAVLDKVKEVLTDTEIKFNSREF